MLHLGRHFPTRYMATIHLSIQVHMQLAASRCGGNHLTKNVDVFDDSIQALFFFVIYDCLTNLFCKILLRAHVFICTSSIHPMCAWWLHRGYGSRCTWIQISMTRGPWQFTPFLPFNLVVVVNVRGEPTATYRWTGLVVSLFCHNKATCLAYAKNQHKLLAQH